MEHLPSGFGLTATHLNTAAAELPFPLHLPTEQAASWHGQLGVGALHLTLHLRDVPLATQRARGLLLALHGHVYGHTPASLLEIYEQQGLSALLSLEGHFTLLLIDVRRELVAVLTDLVGSHKVYRAVSGASLHLDTDLRTLMAVPALRGRALDAAGLGSALASGHMVSGLTPYQGVSSLGRASVHALRPGSPAPVLSRQQFWDDAYTPDPSRFVTRAQQAERRAELSTLLVQAVQRRLVGPDVPTLSLSAGHDARTILGVLGGALGVKEGRAFSYALGRPLAGSDAALSSGLAAHYGYRFRLMPSYQGDLMQTLWQNARWGQGVTNFCDEADAWSALATQPVGQLWVGEHNFGYADPLPLHTQEDVLDRLGLRSWNQLGWLSPMLESGVQSRLMGAWQETLEQVTGSVAHLPSLQDQLDTLYAEQRLQYMLLPWRQHFAARAVRGGLVLNPLLDGDVMRFMRRVPGEWRLGKRLFRETAAGLFPELYQLPFATRGAYEADWAREIARQRGPLLEWLRETSSPLDGWLPPTVLARLIGGQQAGVSRSRALLKSARQALKPWRRTRVALTVMGPLRRVAHPVSQETLLMRALTLRAALQLTERQADRAEEFRSDAVPH
ncbi:hypothetical protein [Deinococcus sonorensis]|uniref:Asparagine synthetase domain-containing protein n=2 Tax=Deinococcus sonorensis TaxID=309891 RepID=A0AAU7UFT5_9DEIO